MGDRVTISVHEPPAEPGYVVKLEATTPDWHRSAKLPTETFEEAEALARSIKGYVDAGCPVEAILGGHDGEPEPAEVSDGCPRCGCRDVDPFKWDDQGDQVMCDRCGKCYLPCGSPEIEEVTP